MDWVTWGQLDCKTKGITELKVKGFYKLGILVTGKMKIGLFCDWQN